MIGASHDYEVDPRPLSECLKEWSAAMGGRRQAAHEMRLPLETLHKMCDGRTARYELMIRRLMTLIGRSG